MTLSVIVAVVIAAAGLYWLIRSRRKEAHHLDDLHITFGWRLVHLPLKRGQGIVQVAEGGRRRSVRRLTVIDTRKLLFEALKSTGDSPEDVSCIYSSVWPPAGGPVPMMPQCSATDLPEGELLVLRCRSKKYVYTLDWTETETKIKTSQY